MEWYYVESDERAGPVDGPGLRSLLDSGRIDAGTLVWCADLPDWKPYGEVQALLDATAASSAGDRRAICIECGGAFSSSEVLQFGGNTICGSCKPVFFQRVRQGTPTGLQPRYAGFWPRFFAKALDGLVSTALQFAIIGVLELPFGGNTASGGMLFSMAFAPISMALGFAYSTWFIGRFGATPGKMALGLRVIGVEQTKVTYGRAFLRALAEIVSSAILWIGYLMVIYDDERRALHDRLCNTRVVHTGS